MIRGLGGSAVKAIYIIKRDRPPNKPPKADCLDEAKAFHQHIQKRRDILDVLCSLTARPQDLVKILRKSQ